jgi:hypothetical protein
LGKTLAEIDALSIDEFVQWMCFYSIEPFGEKRGDIQSAIIAQTMANIHRASDAKPYTVKDFIPEFIERKPERQPLQHQISIWQAIVTAQNAIVAANSSGSAPAGEDAH